MRRIQQWCYWLLAICMLAADVVMAHEPEEEITVPEVTVSGERPVDAASQQIITEEEIQLQPVGRPGNLLRLVPGLITTNPSGAPGKADNFLVRGFDADHGTDVAGFFDGMPLNLRSHAHGQGWLDLNFLIPETIKSIDVSKGPFQVQYGDFATAAAVNFVTRDQVDEGVVQAAGGQFATQRYLLMLSPTRGRVRSLVAAEGYYTDGPFLNPNRAPRFNGLAKFTMNPTPRSEVSLTGTHYQSRWNASGQLPLRAVEAGVLDRFGSVDPSEGGRTLRSTANLRYHYDAPSGGTAFAQAYLQYYRMDLFTNFTFFQDDPVQGDGIEQNDRRFLYGAEVGYRQNWTLMAMPGTVTVGLQARVDDADVRLGTEQRRVPLSTTSDSQIRERSYSPYLKVETQPTSWARLTGGVRADVFQFDVRDLCSASCRQHPNGTTSDFITSPKGNLILGPWFGTEVFLNAGTGFHSNDARAVVSNPNIQSLPRATSYELGTRTRVWDGLELQASVWVLDLTSELVFNGDTGTTDIRGASRRYGTELVGRFKPGDWLTLTGDVTLSHAEFRGTGEAVPQTPTMTARGDITARLPLGFAGSLQMLHLGPRPLTEDRSVTAQPWTIFNVVARYRPAVKGWWRNLEGFLSVQNLFDTKWRQTQLFYESRLATEPAPVGDIHFTPGLPRMVLGGVSWYF